MVSCTKTVPSASSFHPRICYGRSSAMCHSPQFGAEAAGPSRRDNSVRRTVPGIPVAALGISPAKLWVWPSSLQSLASNLQNRSIHCSSRNQLKYCGINNCNQPDRYTFVSRSSSVFRLLNRERNREKNKRLSRRDASCSLKTKSPLLDAIEPKPCTRFATSSARLMACPLMIA
jgi:hypothetical protein